MKGYLPWELFFYVKIVTYFNLNKADTVRKAVSARYLSLNFTVVGVFFVLLAQIQAVQKSVFLLPSGYTPYDSFKDQTLSKRAEAHTYICLRRQI